jgi:hypothetical protein
MKRLAFVILFLASTADAQTFAPSGAIYPSPAGRNFLDGPVAQCVIARPCPFGECVILQPCPPGTLVPPTPTTLPAPVVPPVATPIPEPKESPVTINVYPGSGTVPPVVERSTPKVVAPQKKKPDKPCKCEGG